MNGAAIRKLAEFGIRRTETCKCFAAMLANRRRLQFRVKHGIRNDRYFEHSVALTCASDSQSETVLIGLLRTSFV